jgi:hypothetical protein
MNAADLTRAQAFVASVPWRAVKGVPEGPLHKPPEPHEYVILGWRAVDPDELRWFVGLIRRGGHKGRYVPPYSAKAQVNRYLDLDEHVYWWIYPRMLNRTRIEYGQHERLPEQLSFD